eukprot:3223063-Amphidinium_carterae.1
MARKGLLLQASPLTLRRLLCFEKTVADGEVSVQACALGHRACARWSVLMLAAKNARNPHKQTACGGEHM